MLDRSERNEEICAAILRDGFDIVASARNLLVFYYAYLKGVKRRQ